MLQIANDSFIHSFLSLVLQIWILQMAWAEGNAIQFYEKSLQAKNSRPRWCSDSVSWMKKIDKLLALVSSTCQDPTLTSYCIVDNIHMYSWCRLPINQVVQVNRKRYSENVAHSGLYTNLAIKFITSCQFWSRKKRT